MQRNRDVKQTEPLQEAARKWANSTDDILQVVGDVDYFYARSSNPKMDDKSSAVNTYKSWCLILTHLKNNLELMCVFFP